MTTIRTISIRLPSPPHEMAREEIQKQVVYLSREIVNARFAQDGAVLEFDAPEESAAALSTEVEALARRIQRGLRDLRRKVKFRSSAAVAPQFRGGASTAGVHQLGPGQVALEGLPLRLFRYFDRVFADFGRPWDAQPLLTPTLIPTRVLGRCDYLRGTPQHVTFACHLPEDGPKIARFRERHLDREELDDEALGDMKTPEACLSPAVCYHVYHLNEGRVVPASGLAYGVCGKCFRYESSNMAGLRRLWDFTMREVVFLGGREDVLERRERSIEMMSRFLEEHRLAGEIRTASDPFFLAPDALGKTYFQLSSETKYEISLMLPGEARLAVGSHNYHSDFFGRAFNTTVEGGGVMHSVCVAFGLERCVHAFLAQHGDDPALWPDPVREAPEFRDRH
jgi:seryl-tRNA synthetase